jgi:hypothetical protein
MKVCGTVSKNHILLRPWPKELKEENVFTFACS